MNRRSVLAGAAAAAGAATAGCIGGGREPSHDHDAHTHSHTEDGSAKSTPLPEGAWYDRVEFEDVDRELYVEAERYRFVPGSGEPIRVRLDERVGLAVTALDEGYHSGHGLRFAAYDVDLQALPGGVTSTTFLADRPGEFEVFCDVYCGSGHPEMTGTLVVEA